MATNREKNLAHEQRQRSSQRPRAVEYNFAELEAVVRLWVNPPKEELSPFATCNS